MKKHILSIILLTTISITSFSQVVPTGASYINISNTNTGESSSYISPKPGIYIKTPKSISQLAQDVTHVVTQEKTMGTTDEKQGETTQQEEMNSEAKAAFDKEMALYNDAKAKEQKIQKDLFIFTSNFQSAKPKNSKANSVNVPVSDIFINDISGFNNSSINYTEENGRKNTEKLYLDFLMQN
ncbi:hypothetical protein GW796_07305 [archaeon]|nr:hypothetical protein [archaeon]NCQ51690.1 hypothetical protein [archaeon]